MECFVQCSRHSCSRRASLGRFISTMQTPGQKRSMKPPAVSSSNFAPSARRSGRFRPGRGNGSVVIYVETSEGRERGALLTHVDGDALPKSFQVRAEPIALSRRQRLAPPPLDTELA